MVPSITTSLEGILFKIRTQTHLEHFFIFWNLKKYKKNGNRAVLMDTAGMITILIFLWLNIIQHLVTEHEDNIQCSQWWIFCKSLHTREHISTLCCKLNGCSLAECSRKCCSSEAHRESCGMWVGWLARVTSSEALRCTCRPGRAPAASVDHFAESIQAPAAVTNHWQSSDSWPCTTEYLYGWVNHFGL